MNGHINVCDLGDQECVVRGVVYAHIAVDRGYPDQIAEMGGSENRYGVIQSRIAVEQDFRSDRTRRLGFGSCIGAHERGGCGRPGRSTYEDGIRGVRSHACKHMRLRDYAAA